MLTTQDLDHFAHFHHLSLGYSFDVPWSPRLSLHYDYASGDDDPSDGDNSRYDTLFGSRRFDYGPTSIYGAFARSNINTPGVRLALEPSHEIVAHRLGIGHVEMPQHLPLRVRRRNVVLEEVDEQLLLALEFDSLHDLSDGHAPKHAALDATQHRNHRRGARIAEPTQRSERAVAKLRVRAVVDTTREGGLR